MNAERDWAAAVRRIGELITPSGSQWPGQWRTCVAGAGQPTCMSFFDSRSDHELVIAILESGSGQGAADELSRLLVKVGLASRNWHRPAEALDWLNRSLLKVGFEPPVIAMSLVVLDSSTGRGQIARAGLPPAVVLNPGEPLQCLTSPAPFLGIADVSFSNVEFTITPGGRLMLSNAGRPDQVAAVAQRWDELPGPAFAEAVTRDLLAQTTHPGGVFAVAIEHLATLRMAG
jgi:hypothetical protein